MPCTHIWCVENNFVWVQRLSKVKRGTLQKRTNTINFQPHTTSTLSSQLTELTVNTMAPSKTIFRSFKCSIIDSQLLSFLDDHVRAIIIKVCITPEEEAIDSKACGINICIVCFFRCPKHQKMIPIDKLSLVNTPLKSISFVECIKVEASLGQVYPIFSIKIYIANLHIFPITFGFHFAELNTIVLFSL